MGLAVGPGLMLYVLPSNWAETIRKIMYPDATEEESVVEQVINSQDEDEDIMSKEILKDESSLQLLTPDRIRAADSSTLDEELGIHCEDSSEGLMEEDIQIPDSQRSSPERKSLSINFQEHHFNGNSSPDTKPSPTSSASDADEYELISESELQSFTADTRRPRTQN